tara:strand:- start:15 stop:1043 length:1029 start_codon:yes stop_codon:yes gene_type:complete
MAYTTINKSSDYFNTKLYTGNSSTNNITGVGFQPDLTWLKCRDDSHNPIWFDAIRGVTKRLQSHSNAEESTVSNSLTSFDSDGFTLGSSGGENNNSNTYASWNWLGTNGTTSNTDGSITSTVSANQTAGFSIVSYTSTGNNATVGHGLNAVPSTIIIKRRTGDVEAWVMYHKSLGATKYILFSSSGASTTSSTRFNDTAPTSSVFSLGTSGDTNGGNSPFIAYCFRDVIGYSKYGTYFGNSSGNNFVYTGFKPAFVIWKSIGGEAWGMVDNKRDPYNVTQKHLYPNLSNTEVSQTVIMDLLSNGFNIKWTDSNINGSGNQYIYMAIAEAPLVGTNNVPCTAR